MTPSQAGAFVDGIIPIVGGTLVSLYGYRVIGKPQGADARFDQWYGRFGPMMRIVGPLVVLFGIWRIVPAFTSAEAPPVPISENSRFLPARVGTTWVYQCPGGLVTSRVTGIEAMGGKDCLRREMTVDGKVVHTEHLRPEQGALLKYGINGGRYDPPFPLIYDSAQSPLKWEYRSSNGKIVYQCEQTDGGPLAVPVGRFERTVLVTMRGTDTQGESTQQTWYADGVGLIREVTQRKTFETVAELKSINQPP